jgi:3-oxoacyl-[acyl-carrier-protein] synthase II
MEIVKRGDADVLVAGSTEAPLCILGVGGFSNMHALSTRFNNEPTKASRPWDRDRDGFVIAEGAGVLILEEYQHARRRGAKVYGEVAGYGASGDAYHITAPDNLGRGAKKSMRMALEKAQLEAEAIDYVNAHGTSTLVGDNLEFNAVQETLGKNNPRLLMSSTKSSIGHMLGAAGAVEAVFLAKILEQDIIPPTINLDHIDENCRGIDLVPHTAREKRVNCVMSNSFGFGGTNATLILRKFL